MSFYRKITRERTLCSFNDLNTTDEGLKDSISSFFKTPRAAKFYETFKIQEDYYSKKGVNPREECKNFVSDAECSDSEISWASREIRDLEDEKYTFKEREDTSRKWKKKIPLKWFRKRRKSTDSYLSDANFSEAKSSYGTDMSCSDSRSELNKERLDKMEDDDRQYRCERSRDRKTIDKHISTRSRSRKGYDW